jgi:hypothetical protein
MRAVTMREIAFCEFAMHEFEILEIKRPPRETAAAFFRLGPTRSRVPCRCSGLFTENESSEAAERERIRYEQVNSLNAAPRIVAR